MPAVKDKQAFSNKLFAGELDSLKSFKTLDDLVFWGRSIIDVYGYCKLEGLEISDQLLKACTEIKFSDAVFIFPPWKDIYLNDSERKQSFEQAINTYQVMVGCYRQFGYNLIEMPLDSIQHRLQFVMLNLSV